MTPMCVAEIDPKDHPTVLQILQAVDHYWNNSFSLEEKLHWLSTLDGQIYREILMAHDPWSSSFKAYGGQEAQERTLLVPEPFAQALYLPWMESRMAWLRGETERFNNAVRMFQGAYTDFARWYHRNHSCRPTVRKYW